MVADLQRGAAARQPRPGAAPHVLAEAQNSPRVYLQSGYLTGKLTPLSLQERRPRRSLRPLGGRLAPGCAVLLRARGIHREQRLAAALVWWAARLRCDTPDGAARGERKNS